MDTLVPWNGEGKLLKLLQLCKDNLSCLPLLIIVLRAQKTVVYQLISFYFKFRFILVLLLFYFLFYLFFFFDTVVFF